GYVAWESIWGFWNQLTPRDAATLRRVAAIQRQFAPLVVSMDWTPYEKTLQAGVFASRFPAERRTLWTVVDRNEYDGEGEQVAGGHAPGSQYFDVWNGARVEARIEGGQAILAAKLEGRGFGAFVAVAESADASDLKEFLARMKELARTPLR